MNLKPLVSLAVLCLALAACNRQGPDVPKGVDDNRTLQDPGEGVEAVVVNPDAAHVGSAVDEAGDILEPATRFEVGQTVRIKEGPFADYDATIKEVNADKAKLLCTVILFGRETPVEFEFSAVELI